MKITKFVLSAALLGATLFVAPNVSASAAYSECASERVCLWGNNDYLWMLDERTAGSSTINNLSGDANDEMDSWANNSGTYAGCMWSDANGSGDRQTLGRNSSDNNVAPANSDEVSSWRTAYAC